MMPYLSRIVLNPLKRGAQALLTNPQRMHAAVEGCLPSAGRSGRLLWRQEIVDRQSARWQPAIDGVNATPDQFLKGGKDVHLWVLSPDRPTFDHIVEQAGWIDNEEGAPKIADLAPLLNQLSIGRQFGFRMRLNCANSSRTIDVPTPEQQKRLDDGKKAVVGHSTAEHQMAWFASRTTGSNTRWGFTVGEAPELANARIIARSKDQFGRARQAPAVVLETATFDGVLTITDPEAFRRSLLNGVGRGKAYGCGLITLAPPPHVVES